MSLQESNKNNNLKKLLILSAVVVWGVVAYQIFQGSSASSSSKAIEVQQAGILPELDLSILNTKPIVYNPRLRDPFESYLYTRKPVVKKKAPTKRAPSKPKTNVAPPTATISGFMGGSNPVVILKKGDKSELVKKGSKVWGFTVKSVSSTQVVVIKEGVEFIIK